jgi:hypothetical protein
MDTGASIGALDAYAALIRDKHLPSLWVGDRRRRFTTCMIDAQAMYDVIFNRGVYILQSTTKLRPD